MSSKNYNCSRFKEKSILFVGEGILKYKILINGLNLKRKVFLLIQKIQNDLDDIIIGETETIEKKEETLSLVKKYMLENNINFNGIYTLDENSLLMTAYLAQELSLPGIPFKVADGIRNQEEFLKSIDRLDINFLKKTTVKSVQRYHHINVIENFYRDISNIKNNSEKKDIEDHVLVKITSVKSPFIIKNLHQEKYIDETVRECETLEEYYKNLLESIKIYPKMDIQLESNFKGIEFSINILIQNNNAIFISISEIISNNQNFSLEILSITPSLKLNTDEINIIQNFFSKFIRDLNIQNACLHFHTLCKPKSVYPTRSEYEVVWPIKVESTMCDFATFSSVNTSYGVNLLFESIKISLGIQLNKQLFKFRQNNPIYLAIPHIKPEKGTELCNWVMIKHKLTNEYLREKRENITSVGIMSWIRRKRIFDV